MVAEDLGMNGFLKIWRCEVKDEGIRRRASLGPKDLLRRMRIQSIGRQSINRLSGNGYDLAGKEEIRGLSQGCGVGFLNHCLHPGILRRKASKRKIRTFSSTPTPERLHAV